ncbi:MAG: hypothetical protein LBV78_00245 [Kitasatospora sp.]|jgi:hypothetical protein|nr:hypothetical protein [Kitasatospora sp.]
MAAVTALAGGCSSAGSPGATARHSAPAASARPATRAASPGRPASPTPTGRPASAAASTPAPARREALADRYLAIALPANHRLDHEVEGFADHQRSDLAAAEADLRAEAATEHRFDRRLAAIPFPSGITAMARALIVANQSRAAQTGRQARSASLARLHSLAAQHRAADASVEFGVRLIRQALSLPPPSES